MKSMKKMLALIIAAVMIVGTMSMAVSATSDLTVDAKVTVSGFENGDTVKAYQFIKWVDGSGWAFVSNDITGITVDDVIDGLTKDELAALASAENIAKMTEVTGTYAADGKSWEKECGTTATAGSYLILVTDNNAEHIYNPAVVSADFETANEGAVDLTEEAAMVKKQDVDLDKEIDNKPDDYDVQAGDIVPFTVTVTVPQYNDNWTEPYFAVSDELSAGLTLQGAPTVTNLTVGEDYEITAGGTAGADNFTIKFTETYLKENASAAVTIKYSAVVGQEVIDTAQVHEETNKVTLEFSNNPQNSEDHKTIDDETHHYTFAIDASRMGAGEGSTSELIKVGVDSAGNTVTLFQEDHFPTGVEALSGAEFTLTGTGPNNTGTYEQTATSDENGRIYFKNLEVGTYTLQETKAPAGYVKDPDSHTVEISATYGDNGILESYKITIDQTETSHYSATTSAIDSIVKSSDNQSFPIVNTKGTELPSTGGMGTTLFYIIGAILVLGAGILLVTRRRMSAN